MDKETRRKAPPVFGRGIQKSPLSESKKDPPLVQPDWRPTVITNPKTQQLPDLHGAWFAQGYRRLKQGKSDSPCGRVIEKQRRAIRLQ